MMRAAAIALLVVALQAAVGCGGSDAPEGDPLSPAMSVDEALEAEEGVELQVYGSFVSNGGEARLCEAHTTDRPPRCSGDSLALPAVSDEAVGGERDGDVAWNELVILLGVREGEALRQVEIVDDGSGESG